MFADGVVKSYNTERGFGFISIEGNKKDLFFHIKDFPNKNIEPQIGERLKFRIVDDQGKLRADNIVRLEVKIESVDYSQKKSIKEHSHSQKMFSNKKLSQNNRTQNKYSNESKNSNGIGFIAIGLIIIVGLSYMIYSKFQRAELAAQAPIVTPKQSVVTPVDSNPNGYHCDGRIHCSQMNSREEARWFVRNCPGTKMDGNNDGEPCESDSRW